MLGTRKPSCLWNSVWEHRPCISLGLRCMYALPMTQRESIKMDPSANDQWMAWSTSSIHRSLVAVSSPSMDPSYAEHWNFEFA